MANTFILAYVMHHIADWLLQNDWMQKKISWQHPAAWTHAGIYTLCMMVAFPWQISIIVGISHLMIDTRIPVKWWICVTRKSDIPVVYMGVDQAMHIVILALASLMLDGRLAL